MLKKSFQGKMSVSKRHWLLNRMNDPESLLLGSPDSSGVIIISNRSFACPDWAYKFRTHKDGWGSILRKKSDRSFQNTLAQTRFGTFL